MLKLTLRPTLSLVGAVGPGLRQLRSYSLVIQGSFHPQQGSSAQSIGGGGIVTPLRVVPVHVLAWSGLVYLMLQLVQHDTKSPAYRT